MKNIIFVLLFVSSFVFSKILTIGVSLHPYYSFAKNIVGDKALVVPLINKNSNPHGYTIIPEDIENAMNLDVVILNGVGNDEFAFGILKAAGVYDKIHKIFANDGVALIPQSVSTDMVNSHTFVSISASIQQIYTIANRLAEIDPANANFYRTNASKYAKSLRQMKAQYMEKLSDIKGNDFRCATIHGGYSYLLQEFGFRVEAVIEPSHGVNPTASQMKETIEKIKAAKVQVVFSESDYPPLFIKTIRDETGVRVVSLSHLSNGDYTADFFEKGMRYNLDKLLTAVSGKE
jgi:zinc transport system substrate-binding protein